MTQFKNFKFLADENINLVFTRKCRDLKFDIIHTSEIGLNGKSDQEILQFALDRQLIVITCDSDFAKMAFVDRASFLGIVYLRPNHIHAEHHLETLQHIIIQDLDFQPPFVLVAERYDDVIRIRLRNSPFQ